MTILFPLLVALIILTSVILIEPNINAAISSAPQEMEGRGRGVAQDNLDVRRTANSSRGAFVVNNGGRRGGGSVTSSSVAVLPSPSPVPSVPHVVVTAPPVVAPAKSASAAVSSHSSTSSGSHHKKLSAKDIPGPQQLQIEIEKLISAGILKNNPSSLEAYISTRVGAPVKIKKGVVGEVANTLLSAVM